MTLEIFQYTSLLGGYEQFVIETWKKPPWILIALYYLKLKEGEIPLSYPTLTLEELIGKKIY